MSSFDNKHFFGILYFSKSVDLEAEAEEEGRIQALSSLGFHYLTEKYLPLKLQQKDWL